jgi:hypothetical protein
MRIKRPSSANLCDQCSRILPLLVDVSTTNKNVADQAAWWNETYGTVRSIQGLSPGKCELCLALQAAFGKVQGFSSADTRINISHRRLAAYNNLEHVTCVFEACGVKIAFAPVIPVVQTDAGEFIQAFTGRFVAPLIHPSLARQWLNTCEKSHAGCTPARSSNDFNFSFRLIDVNKSCLVEAPPDCRYVALSYVWGDVEQVTLSKETRHFLEQEGSISENSLKDLGSESSKLRTAVDGKVIPRTIRDAMLLCRLLGEHYLWTDSLCILQDDDYRDENGAWTNADKIAQIPKMDVIYGASIMTIIAAAGVDSNAGLPGVHKSDNRTAQSVAQIGDQDFVSIDEDPLQSFWSSKWNERAWTFQEFLLSKRHLIFLPEQVVFNCSTLSWSEDHSLEFIEDPTLKSVPAWTRSYRLNILQMPDVSKMPERTYLPAVFINRFYNQWLKNFLKRRLTVKSDILFAFDGALSVSSHHIGKFHFGIPIDHFCQCLHWIVDKNSKSTLSDKRQDQAITVRRQGFPSWSWAGWLWDGPNGCEYDINFQTTNPKYWCRVSVYGIVLENDNFGLWEITKPDMSNWNRFGTFFKRGTFALDTEYTEKTLLRMLEKIKAIETPLNCLIIKTFKAEVYLSRDRENWIAGFKVFSSESADCEVGSMHFPSEWQEDKGKGLQIIITGSFFYGLDARGWDIAHGADPIINCLAIQMVDEVVAERLAPFSLRTSQAKLLQWRPCIRILK